MREGIEKCPAKAGHQIVDKARVVHAGCGVKPYPAYKIVQIRYIAVTA
ncbi:hypothetical protein EAKF1_ch2206c [Escherichia albertii KF1]|nr:hypothetical protein EAKF1_ch2206c [Escherichia albertii KF1]